MSVYDKTGLVEFVSRLVAAGYEIVSSGGTSAALVEAGVAVTPVDQVTGAPEILGGRVKTLHPKIHGGILARGDADQAELDDNGIARFDLVVCNLYPFEETVANADATEMDIIEKIDIGGPAMVRAAAKNHHHVAVVVSPDQYEEVATAIESEEITPELRRRLATEAFAHTARYDAAIVGWMGGPETLSLSRVSDLRYGENPHQAASAWAMPGAPAWWVEAVQHQGKEMSFNNYADTEAAWRLAAELGEGAVVVVKHTNAAGAARGSSISEAFERAWAGDPMSAFGGVIAINGELDGETALALVDRFVEVVVARSVDSEALDGLAAKKNVRVLTAPLPSSDDSDFRRIEGGFLVQDRDRIELDGWRTVSRREPSPEELESLRFAWVVAAHTKSNAIVIASGTQAVGVGAGDQSRVGAAERAVAKAGDRAIGSVAASDAFFPFRDGIDTLADAGIIAIVQPGGSINDDEVVAAADERGLALVFTDRRHFRH